MPENVIVVRYGVAGQPALAEQTFHTNLSVGYNIDDPKTPNCARVWFGRKTIIVPLTNLGMLELDI